MPAFIHFSMIHFQFVGFVAIGGGPLEDARRKRSLGLGFGLTFKKTRSHR